MTQDLVAIENSLPLGSLSAYISWANRLPMLSAEEEYALAVRLQEEGDLDAARRLVMSHLRFVVSLTRNYLGYGLPHEDLIQEGNVGLMKAVKRFDPSVGVRLISFAAHWIKAEVHEFLLRNWRIVKVATTKAQRKLFFNLRRMTKNTGHRLWLTNGEVASIAKDLGVKPDDVRTMEMRLQRKDKSFDRSAADDEKDGGSSSGGFLLPADYLGDPASDPAYQIELLDTASNASAGLQNALAQLKPRLRDILEKRWLAEKKATLQELAAAYGVSAERVRQLEKQALSTLKRTIRR